MKTLYVPPDLYEGRSTKETRVAQAVVMLNVLIIERGYDYPEAEEAACSKCRVSAESVRKAYDAQF